MPSGQKYLLLLSAAPHALLAGKDTLVAVGNNSVPPDGTHTSAGGTEGGNSGHRGRHGSGAGRGSKSETSSGSPRQGGAEFWAQQSTNVESVSTAYLDALVKDDPIASEWLSRNARRWLATYAELLIR